MNSSVMTAVNFAVVLPTLLVAHNLADHWIQTEVEAAAKGRPGWEGRLACAMHVTSYTTVCTLALYVVIWLFALPISVAGLLAGLAVSAVSHYWADRRTTLERLAVWVGKSGFFRFGAPRPGRDDNPSLGTGAYALDQSWHWTWLFVAALVISLLPGSGA